MIYTFKYPWVPIFGVVLFVVISNLNLGTKVMNGLAACTCITERTSFLTKKRLLLRTSTKHKVIKWHVASSSKKKYQSVRPKSLKFKRLLDIGIYGFGPGPGRKLRWPPPRSGAGAIFNFRGRLRGRGGGGRPRSFPALCTVAYLVLMMIAMHASRPLGKNLGIFPLGGQQSLVLTLKFQNFRR